MPRTHQNGLVKQVMRICLAQLAAILISVLAVLTVLAAVIVFMWIFVGRAIYYVAQASHCVSSYLVQL
jgi:flagellar basal body-associated protein FliL